MASIVYLSEETVKGLLNWEQTIEAVEIALKSVTNKSAVQSARTFTQYSSNSLLLTMPGYLNDSKFGGLGCKLVTSHPNNAYLTNPLPTIMANIALFDEANGILKAIIAGTEITAWRTAAASAIATKYLTNSRKKEVLAILGAGVQGKSHAAAFDYYFKFKEIRIWNRTPSKAKDLVDILNQNDSDNKFKYNENNEECVKDADVVITATHADSPILELEWLKEDVHINAVGAGANHHSELSSDIYLKSKIYIDHMEGAEKELIGLTKLGVKFEGEIGRVITGDLHSPQQEGITIFQSLGMAVEDCAMARVVYDNYKKH